jgi:hypothetical protein
MNRRKEVEGGDVVKERNASHRAGYNEQSAVPICSIKMLKFHIFAFITTT